MKTYAKLKDGTIWIVWGDNYEKEIMTLVSFEEANKKLTPGVGIKTREFPYSEIAEVDTNLVVLFGI